MNKHPNFRSLKVSMRQTKLAILPLALSLLSFPAQAWADAADLGQKPDPLPLVDAGSEAGRNADGASAKAITATAVQASYQPLTGRERWKLYVRETVGTPGAFFRAAGPALGAQMSNDPAVWGQGMEGYSKRLANRFGRFALQETYEAAGAALLQHEVRYIRSKRPGFWPRTAHALTANFITYDRNGRRTPHVARIGSTFASEFTGNLWMPAGYRDATQVMRGATMQLSVGGTFNLLREFAPELKRILPWKRGKVK